MADEPGAYERHDKGAGQALPLLLAVAVASSGPNTEKEAPLFHSCVSKTMAMQERPKPQTTRASCSFVAARRESIDEQNCTQSLQSVTSHSSSLCEKQLLNSKFQIYRMDFFYMHKILNLGEIKNQLHVCL